MRSNLQIKGTREGILITLGEGTWENLKESLIQQINEQGNFFHGARVALDVGNQTLHAVDLGGLRDQLSEKGISLWAVLSNSPTTEQTSQVLGLSTRLTAPKPDRAIRAIDTNLTGENAILIQKTLRSGFKITFQGHVTVIGDVNPGAEIIAAGSVIIWGKLKGVVHAGAEGDEKAVVCSLDLLPAQLRIASITAIPAQRKGKPQPEMAKIVGREVIAEIWKQKGR